MSQRRIRRTCFLWGVDCSETTEKICKNVSNIVHMRVKGLKKQIWLMQISLIMQQKSIFSHCIWLKNQHSMFAAHCVAHKHYFNILMKIRLTPPSAPGAKVPTLVSYSSACSPGETGCHRHTIVEVEVKVEVKGCYFDSGSQRLQLKMLRCCAGKPRERRSGVRSRLFVFFMFFLQLFFWWTPDWEDSGRWLVSIFFFFF